MRWWREAVMVRGLIAHDNGCYFTAALQCLLFMPPLTNMCLSTNIVDASLHKRKVHAPALAAAYAAFVKDYWAPAGCAGSPNRAPLECINVWQAFCKLHKAFANVRQHHDAQEAMVLMLQSMHDGLSKAPVPASPLLERRPANHEAWERHIAKHGYSPLVEIFQGQMRVEIEGAPASAMYEHFWQLSLPIQTSSTILQSIKEHLAPEQIDNGTIIRRTMLYPPLILIIQLKRFDAAGNKIDKFVHYDSDLDLSSIVSESAWPAQYSLCGVCMHQGTTTSGHYTAMCEVKGSWFALNDAACSPVTDLNSIIDRGAYMLVFKRRLPPPPR